jgi:hypothetical protein
MRRGGRLKSPIFPKAGKKAGAYSQFLDFFSHGSFDALQFPRFSLGMSFAKPFFGGSPIVGMQSSEAFSERKEGERLSPFNQGE